MCVCVLYAFKGLYCLSPPPLLYCYVQQLVYSILTRDARVFYAIIFRTTREYNISNVITAHPIISVSFPFKQSILFDRKTVPSDGSYCILLSVTIKRTRSRSAMQKKKHLIYGSVLFRGWIPWVRDEHRCRAQRPGQL
jgi:hypothetical protein